MASGDLEHLDRLKLIAEIEKVHKNLENSAGQFELVKEIKYNKAEGFPLYELRNDALLLYIQCVCHIMTMKLQGKNITNHPSILKSIKLRTLIEKLDPLFKKIDLPLNEILKPKLNTSNNLKNPSTRNNYNNINALETSENDLKANPFSLIPDETSKKFENGDDKLKTLNSLKTSNGDENGVYKVKRDFSLLGETDTIDLQNKTITNSSKFTKKEKSELEREKRRRMSSGAMEAFREDVRKAAGLPMKQTGGLRNMDAKRVREVKKIMDREEYELENFVRLPVNKKEAKRRIELQRMAKSEIDAEVRSISATQEWKKTFATKKTRQKKTKKRRKVRKTK